MRIIPITSLDQSEAEVSGIEDYANLTDVALRRKLEPAGGLYMAESEKVIRRALAAGHRPRSLLTQEKFLAQAEALFADFPDVPVFLGSEALLEQLTGYRMHRGVMAAMHRPELLDPAEILRTSKTVLVLEDIVDHTNVGAAFRNAAGLGADAVFVTPECADPLYRRSVRVSMGTVLQVPWTRLPAWHEAGRLFREHGFELAALALEEDAVTLREFAAKRPEKVALLLGTEGNGLSRAALRESRHKIVIPMHHEVDSLNVAAASAVALYALLDDVSVAGSTVEK
ncbi:TrmH family RNA methyltransferase [Gulosibacter molinativorax]|uniref:RNA methyltransferase n=1 Tax=Gulosibacter molinativorax TaxID=256821 RepID=A0ABT7C7V2_9MICO|nr:RNA methyltransferase [Gulosibacter molinativorax]MDJ1371145.1 RNA methyltransferase [Gulosibacter molinativorax]QUY61505.1 rRNA methyltransferase [Gulosibacter molinativorax]